MVILLLYIIVSFWSFLGKFFDYVIIGCDFNRLSHLNASISWNSFVIDMQFGQFASGSTKRSKVPNIFDQRKDQ